MADIICGRCLLPISPTEIGVRHMGHRVAHSAPRCIELLRSRIDSLEKRLASCREDSKSMYEQGLYNCRMAEAWKKRARDAADALDLTADFLAEENAKAGLAMGGTIEGIRNDAAKARRAPTESDGTGEI